MEEDDDEERKLQVVLPTPSFTHAPCRATKTSAITELPWDHPSLDLSLSISIGPQQPPETLGNGRNVQALKQHTTEQMRLAAVERDYAERVRDLTRRELEMADRDFAVARMVWERARQEVERVERMKEMATRRISSSCMEITCQACRRRFRPL